MTGMEQNNDSLGRDTEVCGDPLFWFPMRVTYSRELGVVGNISLYECTIHDTKRYRYATTQTSSRLTICLS